MLPEHGHIHMYKHSRQTKKLLFNINEIERIPASDIMKVKFQVVDTDQSLCQKVSFQLLNELKSLCSQCLDPLTLLVRRYFHQ